MATYLLPDDLVVLNKQIQETQEKINSALARIGESRDEGGGNSFHDNFAFEDGQRQATMWSTHLRQLMAIKRDAIVIAPDRITSNHVCLGVLVTIKDNDLNEIYTFRIRGYVDSQDEEALSYNAPLAHLINGAKVGETKIGEINGQKKSFEILKIEKP